MFLNFCHHLDGYLCRSIGRWLGRAEHSAEYVLQDSSSFAHEGEEVSFLQLQARAMEVGQILVGFYDIPKSVEQPLQLVINPEVSLSAVQLTCILADIREQEIY